MSELNAIRESSAEAKKSICIYRDSIGLAVYVNKSSDSYTVTSFGKFEAELKFQNGAPSVNGVNGLTNETLLAILIHRTKVLDAQFPCIENHYALEHMEQALAMFEVRTARSSTSPFKDGA